MKRLFTILAMAALVATASLATSCEGPMGPQGIPGRDGDLQSASFHIHISPNQWVFDPYAGELKFLFTDAPELTPYVVQNGSLNMYYDLGNSEYEPLPVTIFKMDDQGYRWEYNITCEYRPYEILFVMRSDDFDVIDNDLRDAYFRFTAVW